MKYKYDIATPYTACYAIMRQGSKILFILRSNTDWMNNKYGLAAGKIEKGETFKQGTVREAKEEAGVDIDPADLEHVLTIHRKAGDCNIWVDVFFEVTKWSGKPYNAEPNVHSKVEWIDASKLPRNTIPMVKFAIDKFKLVNHTLSTAGISKFS